MGLLFLFPSRPRTRGSRLRFGTSSHLYFRKPTLYPGNHRGRWLRWHAELSVVRCTPHIILPQLHQNDTRQHPRSPLMDTRVRRCRSCCGAVGTVLPRINVLQSSPGLDSPRSDLGRELCRAEARWRAGRRRNRRTLWLGMVERHQDQGGAKGNDFGTFGHYGQDTHSLWIGQPITCNRSDV